MAPPRRTKRARDPSESPLAKKKALVVIASSDNESEPEGSAEASKLLIREAIVLPWWHTGLDVERIRTFMEYCDSDFRIALARVPATADWGRGRCSALLCVGGEPIRLWVVGTLQDISYTASDVVSRAGCNIVVGLLRDIDRESLHMLHAKSYPSNGEPHLVFHAASEATGGECLTIFPSVYDATTAFQSKSSMKSLSQRDLVVGDIVLVEASITRRDVGRRRASRGWTTWAVDFTLHAVSRLVPRVLVKQEVLEDNFVISM